MESTLKALTEHRNVEFVKSDVKFVNSIEAEKLLFL